MNKIFVLGGTGFVGRHLCEQLNRAGQRITVATRRLVNAQAIQSLPLVTPIEVDVFDEAQLARQLAGHDAVVNLIAILHGSEDAFERTHVELPERILRAARKAGVRRVIHVSALGVAVDAPSRYLRSKARGEAVFRNAAAAGLIDLTVFRPSVIFGADDRFLNLFAELQRKLPVMPLARAQARLQPVWVEDVALGMTRAISGPQSRESLGQIYEAAGPEVYTLGELARAAGAWAGVNEGRGRPVLPLPDALGWLQAALLELLPGEPLMSRDNLDSLKVDNVATGAYPGLEALGIRPAPPSGIAPGYLGHRGPRSGLDLVRRRVDTP
ncbi:complex I NDUFA9 subunit family protein [Tibeticola sp.]|uniref:complex I NDUFA9 subunit family protein n=1 Tax=Tibeticola sp. TaxID=2005368 RepID=UPI00258F6A0E|nr:complex I NDUFA9 subunit family protein [Tibeticola sp.]MCI4440503.1 complex I NDUFA9 subunit family protein [Tibeticola sp.]